MIFLTYIVGLFEYAVSVGLKWTCQQLPIFRLRAPIRVCFSITYTFSLLGLFKSPDIGESESFFLLFYLFDYSIFVTPFERLKQIYSFEIKILLPIFSSENILSTYKS